MKLQTLQNLTLVTALLVSAVSEAQAIPSRSSSEIIVEALEGIDEIRRTGRHKIIFEHGDLERLGPDEFFEAFAPFSTDPSERVRRTLADYACFICARTGNSIDRRRTVRFLVESILPSGTDQAHHRYATERLSIQFNRGDFDRRTRKDVLKHWRTSDTRVRGSVRLLGLIQAKEFLPEIHERILSEEALPQYIEIGYWHDWYSRITAARLGDNEQANICVRLVREHTKNLYERNQKFQGLAFTRSEVAIEYLYSQLMSDEVQHTGSDTFPWSVAGPALLALAPCFEDFPVSPISYVSASLSVSRNDIETAREWMKNWRDHPILK